MKADFSENNTLAFPLSLSAETTGPEVEGPSRFARALKRARFARGWTQAKLAAQLAIPKRSIVSWETGERIPSVGMVMLLLDALFPGEELSFQRELITAYIVDDLERQEQRRDSQHGQGDPLLRRVQRVMAQVLQLPTTRPQEKVDEQQALEPLFALMAQLRQHPELIPVTRDFIRELAPDE